METKEIKILLADGNVSNCIVGIAAGGEGRLVFYGYEPGGPAREYSGRDIFEALTALRADLEGNGCRVLCAGSRVDVYPSGMSRSMGGGRKAYVTKLGSPVQGEGSLVDIFDYAEPQLVGTVEEQKAFREQWVKSIAANSDAVLPYPGEVEGAARNPGGWVYRIAGHFGPTSKVPPEAIVGAWRVNKNGEIEGPFTRNAKYDPVRFPAKGRGTGS